MSAAKAFQGPAWFALLGMFTVMALAYVWPLLSELEGRLLPVTSRTVIENAETVDGGVEFFVSFAKDRACEFRGLTWSAGPRNRPIPVRFESAARQRGISRSPGEHATGPWRLSGVTSLEGVRAVATHRCHPFWLTYTQFYP